MKQVLINLYSFSELSDAAKETAILEHGEFLDSQPEEYENEQGEMESEYFEHSREDIIDSIEANAYIFFEDGSLAHCTTYTDGHPKTGTTEFHFKGRTYDITQ